MPGAPHQVSKWQRIPARARPLLASNSKLFQLFRNSPSNGSSRPAPLPPAFAADQHVVWQQKRASLAEREQTGRAVFHLQRLPSSR
jgi:hypothetical protein